MEVFQADEVPTHLYLRELFHGVVKMLTKFHFTDWNAETIAPVNFTEKKICMTCLQALVSLSPSEPDTCTQWFMNHSFRRATHFEYYSMHPAFTSASPQPTTWSNHGSFVTFIVNPVRRQPLAQLDVDANNFRGCFKET